MDVDAAGGWAFCEPFVAEHEQLAAQAAVALDPTDLDVGDTASRALRVLLGAGCVLPHSALRLAVLGSGTHAHSGSRRSAWGREVHLAVQTRPRRRRRLPTPNLLPADVHACLPPTHAGCSKCLLELALAGLTEQGLVVRQGYGPLASLAVSSRCRPSFGHSVVGIWARRCRLDPPGCAPASTQLGAARPGIRPQHTVATNAPCTHPRQHRNTRSTHVPPACRLQVPDAAMPRAEALAYSEFPDEGQLPRYASHHAALLGGGAAAGGRPGSACHAHHGLNRLRRHSSPRQFGHRPMAGALGPRVGAGAQLLPLPGGGGCWVAEPRPRAAVPCSPRAAAAAPPAAAAAQAWRRRAGGAASAALETT